MTLIAEGGACGADTFSIFEFVTVDSTMPCIVWMPTNGTADVQTACQGTLYDNGGPTANYEDLTNGIMTISPLSASSVTLNFTSFNYEAGYDYLYIYDGADAQSPLIGAYDGAALPNGGSITSSSGSITLRHFSDNFVNESGFALNWNCSFPNSLPVVDFTADVLQTCSGLVNFRDLSTEGPISWQWDFGDGNTSTEQNPTHMYITNDTYDVSLTATNLVGGSAHTKSAYLFVDKPAPPSASDSAICEPASVQLSASGSGTLQWYDQSNSVSPIQIGSSYSTPVLSSTTNYYVEDLIASPTQNVGMPSNNVGAGDYFGSTSRYLFFDVFQSVILESVLVYANSGATRTIMHEDAFGGTIQDTTLFISSGTSRINLNFEMEPGTGYRLALGGFADVYRNDGGVSFPYEIPGLLSITGANTSVPNYYYFFYDWEVKEPDCLSERAEVTVEVNSFGCCNAVETLFTDEIEANSATLNWIPESNAFSYVLRGKRLGDPDWVSLNVSGGTTDSKEVFGLPRNTTFVWQVRAVCDFKGVLTSDWSRLDTFKTECPVPENVWTSNVTQNSAVLNWTPIPGADGYLIKGRAIGQNWVQVAINNGSTSSLTATGLTPFTTYEWRVKAKCNISDNFNSVFSSLTDFTTVFNVSKNSTYKEVTLPNTEIPEIMLFPNPSGGEFFVEFEMPVSKSFTIEIYDAVGKNHFQTNFNASRSLSKIPISVSDKGAGVYFVKLTTGNHLVMKKLVIK